MDSKYAMALHVAVAAGEKAIDFVEHLVCRMPNDLISVKDAGGNTALSIAAAVGNKAAATILVANNDNLLYVPNISGDFPIHVAAKHAQRDMLIYLISVTKDDHTRGNPYGGFYGLALLISTIEATLYDVALYLLKKYPYLAGLKLSANSALKSIVEYKFGNNGYPGFPFSLTLMHADGIGSNVESLYISPPVAGLLDGTIFNVFKHIVLSKRYWNIKRKLVIEIVKFLCNEMKILNFIEVEDIFQDVILVAAKLGDYEIVEEILKACPCAFHCSDPSFLQSIIHVAVENRCIRVFNFLYQMSDHTHLNLDLHDSNGNNLLHLAAKSAPQLKLSRLRNAAIQMQREMHWYKEVEKLIHPRCREQLNNEGESPRTIFDDEHKQLREEGERWVKYTVNSCTITAALISTIGFAAAITVPGGNDSNTGLALFKKDPVFTIFAFSNAVSLISSATCLLTFLAVSTSRYAGEDFLLLIPFSFLLGLWCLIVSIGSMMMTFTATVYLMLGRRDMTYRLSLIMIVMEVSATFIVLLKPLLQDFHKMLGMNHGFLGKGKELPHADESVANKKVATKESV